MKRFFFLTPFITIILTCTGISSPTDENGSEVEFSLFRGYLILARGSIGPLENLKFLVDTGATSSVLSQSIADKLELKTIPKKIYVYGKQMMGRAGVLRHLQLGSVRFTSVPVLIQELSMLPQVGTHIDAIIGMNVLRRSDFRIDYAARILTFGTLGELGDRSGLPISLVD